MAITAHKLLEDTMYCEQNKSSMRQILNSIGYLLLGIVAASMLYRYGDKSESQPTQYKAFDFRTFDYPIIADAPGCEIRSPQGELMNHSFKEAAPGRVTIQKGTTLTVDCFPIQSSEKSALVDPLTNKSE